MRFTQEPSDPSYFNNGSDVDLVWDYTDPHNKVQNIIYSVLVNTVFVQMMVMLLLMLMQMVSKNILIFHFLTKEELPWLSRTSTLETIRILDVR